MGKVRDWIMKYPVEKERDDLLEERNKEFRPLAYDLEIINKIDVTKFDSEFKTFKKEWSTIAHEKAQLPRLSLVQFHLKNNRDTIRTWDKTAKLSYYDNSSCFIYYFTIEETFDSKDPNFGKKKDSFLEKANGEKISDIQYDKKPVQGSYETYERLMYIGVTTDISSRLKAHEVYRKLHEERFKNAKKNIYISKISLDEELVNYDPQIPIEGELIETPLDIIAPAKLANNILLYLESIFINYFKIPEFNNRDTIPKIFFFTEGIEDLWDKIPFPESIKIDKYDKSTFFRKPFSLVWADIIEIFNRIPRDQLEAQAKKAGIDITKL